MSKETKEKIMESLEGYKEYNVNYLEEVEHSRIFKAKSEEELKEKFYNGELEFDDKDIIGGTLIDDSLEISEVEQ